MSSERKEEMSNVNMLLPVSLPVPSCLCKCNVILSNVFILLCMPSILYSAHSTSHHLTSHYNIILLIPLVYSRKVVKETKEKKT